MDTVKRMDGPSRRTVYLTLAAAFACAVALYYVETRSHATAATATGAVHGRDHATLDLLDGAGTVHVRAAELGDTMYRIHSPQGPRVTEHGDRVEVHGDPDLTVELNRGVRWTLRFTGGAQNNTADLGGLRRLDGVEYVGGVSAVDLTLPGPAGTVPVRVTGGAGTVRIHTTADVRVRAGGGAGGVTIDGTAHNGVAAGAVFATPGWDAAADRYDIDAAAGFSTLVIG